MRRLTVGLFAIVLVAAIVGLLLQTTLFHLIPFVHVIPDLILILCVYLGLHQHSFAGSTAAFLLGYFTDSVSGSAVGLHAFAMSLVFVLVYLVSRRLWMDNVVANVAMVFVAALLKTLTVAGLLDFVLFAEVSWGAFLSNMWLEALVAALFTPVIFRLLDGSRHAWGLD
jgi:rod shape-determining protein MreD